MGDSSIYLNEINKLARKGAFALTFSYSRALQSSCIKIWGQGRQVRRRAGAAPGARAGQLRGLEGRVRPGLAALDRGVAVRQELRLLSSSSHGTSSSSAWSLLVWCWCFARADARAMIKSRSVQSPRSSLALWYATLRQGHSVWLVCVRNPRRLVARLCISSLYRRLPVCT